MTHLYTLCRSLVSRDPNTRDSNIKLDNIIGNKASPRDLRVPSLSWTALSLSMTSSE